MKVFRDLFKRMGVSALWFLGIFVITIAILYVIFQGLSTQVDISLSVVFDIATRVYMVIIGIVCTLVYFPIYLAVGVTRKQFFIGLFASGALLSLCFAVLRIPLLIMSNTLSPLAVLVPALQNTLAFLVGWVGVIGFQYMRTVPIIISITCANLMPQGLIQLEKMELSLLTLLWISIIAIALIATGLYLATRRIPVKC
jgi:hypothetical protein